MNYTTSLAFNIVQTGPEFWRCLWKFDWNRALLTWRKIWCVLPGFSLKNRSGNDSQIKRNKESVSLFEEVTFIFGKSMSTQTSVSRASTTFHLRCQTSLGKDVLESVSDVIFRSRSVQLPVNMQYYHLLNNAYTNVLFQSATYFYAVAFVLVHLLSFFYTCCLLS